uniref:Uncharacterized protein n=1 Tax=Tolypothrix bouteillei VB521301 TaxID=1479485 RepID=A0A0C1NA81_9CYAN
MKVISTLANNLFLQNKRSHNCTNGSWSKASHASPNHYPVYTEENKSRLSHCYPKTPLRAKQSEWRFQ